MLMMGFVSFYLGLDAKDYALRLVYDNFLSVLTETVIKLQLYIMINPNVISCNHDERDCDIILSGKLVFLNSAITGRMDDMNHRVTRRIP